MANRKDAKGRVLKAGESQRKDGIYMYRYTDIRGKRQSVYAGVGGRILREWSASKWNPICAFCCDSCI